MGAVVNIQFVPKTNKTTDTTIKSIVKDMISLASSSYGQEGYTGTIAEADGVTLELAHIYDPDKWVFFEDFVDKVAEKWGPAVVVSGRQNGEAGYFVCGVYSS